MNGPKTYQVSMVSVTFGSSVKLTDLRFSLWHLTVYTVGIKVSNSWKARDQFAARVAVSDAASISRVHIIANQRRSAHCAAF